MLNNTILIIIFVQRVAVAFRIKLLSLLSPWLLKHYFTTGAVTSLAYWYFCLLHFFIITIICLVNSTRMRITPKHQGVKYHESSPYFTTPIIGRWWQPQTETEHERKPQACVNTGQHGPIKDVYTWGEKVRFWTTWKKIMNTVIKYV